MQTASNGLSRNARLAFGIAAGVAWFGLSLSFVLTVLGVYEPLPPLDPQLIGSTASSVFDRVVDFASYFTHWSNITAAIVMTMLARGSFPNTERFKVLRFDAVVMMTITGIVYSLLLAADAKLQGLEVITNFTQHYFTPVSTVALFLVFGPRGWTTWKTPFKALVLPIIWAVYTLIRGQLLTQYPYDFINVAKYGFVPVMTTVAIIIAFGVFLGLVFWVLDLLVGRVTGRVAETELA